MNEILKVKIKNYSLDYLELDKNRLIYFSN